MTQVSLFDYTTEQIPNVIVDANVLLLYLVGLVDRSKVTQYKRTSQYSGEDFTLLAEALGRCRTVIVTPSILTEVSNLTKHASQGLRRKLRFRLRILTEGIEEMYLESSKLVDRPRFIRLGLSDVSIVEAARTYHDDVVVLTDDVGVYDSAWAADVEAVNFTHMVTARWRREE